MARQTIDLELVARRHRVLLWFVAAVLLVSGLAFVMLLVAPPWVLSIIGVLSIIVQIGAIVSVLQLQSALGVGLGWRIAVAVLLFAPCISLLVLLGVNSDATRRLRAAGLKVGLLGVDAEQARRVLDPDRCTACGYQLHGNLSGVCPECGADLGPV